MQLIKLQLQLQKNNKIIKKIAEWNMQFLLDVFIALQWPKEVNHLKYLKESLLEKKNIPQTNTSWALYNQKLKCLQLQA